MLWVDQALNDMYKTFGWAIRIVLPLFDRLFHREPFIRGGYAPPTLEVTDYKPPSSGFSLSGYLKTGCFFYLAFFFCGFVAFGAVLVYGLLKEYFCLGVLTAALYLAVIYMAWRWYRSRKAKSAPFGTNPDIAPWDLSQARVFTILLPRSIEWDAAKAHQFMNHLLVTFGYGLAFQIVADAERRISWQVTNLRSPTAPNVMLQAVRSFYPEADVSFSPFTESDFAEPFYRRVFKFSLLRIFPAPLAFVSDLDEYDPLNGLSTALLELQAGERFIYTLYVADIAHGADLAGEGLIRTTNIRVTDFASIAGAVDAAARHFTGAGQEPRYVDYLQHQMQEKLANPLFKSLILVQIDTPDEERTKHLGALAAHLTHFNRMRFNELTLPESQDDWFFVDSSEKACRTNTLGVLGSWVTNKNLTWREVLLVLEPRELAALWHLPHKGYSAPTIRWLSGKHTPLPEQLETSRGGVCLGDNHYAGRITPVFIQDDARAAHMIVFGKTEMGKSTLLHNLIRQDIAAGHGVAVIDPHRNLVRDILQMSIPPERENDVVVWDLANQEYPPPLNPLAGLAGHDRLQGANQVMTILEKIYADFGATRMGYNLNKALQTVMVDDTPTLMDVARVFRDENYRNQLLDRAEDAELDAFWEDFERRSVSDQDELTLPILRRMDGFTGNPILRPIMCHPNNLSFADLITQNKVILISLQPPPGMSLPPHSEQLLGSVLVSQFQTAVMAEAATTRYYLYIDEAQKFVSTPIPEMFNEARKRLLSLTLANQWLRQLAGEMLHAIMGNVGAIVAFQCERADAAAIEPYMRPSFAVDDLVQLDKHQAAVFMRHGDAQLPAFSLNTRDLAKPENQEVAQATEMRIRACSQVTYTPKSLEDIQAWLAERYPRARRNRGAAGSVEFSEPVDPVE